MRLRSIKQANVGLKNVLIRASLDVPLDKRGRVLEPFRLERNLETFRWVLCNHGRCIILGHRGQPGGKTVSGLSLRPLAADLARRLRRKVRFVSLHKAAMVKAARSLLNGDVLLLENLRFVPGEEKASENFARQLADLGDVYVNDDFATSHRNHASIGVLPKLLPHYAGLNLLEEVHTLERIRGKVRRPFVAIVGGKKIHDKLGMMQELLPRLDAVLLGGGAATTLMKLEGQRVGKSLVDMHLRLADLRVFQRSAKISVPVDSRIGTNLRSNHVDNIPIQTIPKNAMILDIGEETARSYARVLQTAQTVLWAGPVGYFENPAFRKGSATLLRAIPRKAFSVVGGGDTVHMIDVLHGRSRFSFLSTGGGAMLAFLAGEHLPGLEALQQ